MLEKNFFLSLLNKKNVKGSLASRLLPQLKVKAKAKEDKRPQVIWLETNTCDGEILSFLNTLDPGMEQILHQIIDLRYSNFLMAAEGDMATQVLTDLASGKQGKFTLVVEGAIPTGADGLYSVVGHYQDRMLTSLEAVQMLGKQAEHVLAFGTCACFGGPHAANPNPTGNTGVGQILDRKVINVSGCPPNPDWMVGTLAHVLWYGEPELDAFNRPTLFYGESIHNLCQRRHYFDSGIFAKEPGEPWCLYKIGCKGPTTYADCPKRLWNGGHVCWPVGANAPCIGCVNPDFPDGSMPFNKRNVDLYLPNTVVNANKFGAAVVAMAAAGIGSNLLGKLITGRLAKAYKLKPSKLPRLIKKLLHK